MERKINNTAIIGFVRYSCFTPSWGKKSHDYLNPTYLDYRFKIFRNVTLKSFQEQSDKEFNVFLLHSKNLPQKYKDIFQKLEEDNGFLHNIYIPDSESIGNVVLSSIEYVNFMGGVTISFRIDNDDALPLDFISRIKCFLKPEFIGYVISIPKISIIQRIKEIYIIQESYEPSNSMGIAYVSNEADYKTIMNLRMHHKVKYEYPMVLIPGIGGIRTINGKNVANGLALNLPVSKYDTNTLRSFLIENKYPDIDFECLDICNWNIFIKFAIVIKKILRWITK